ncbi:MAG: patatin-like phospholipase family protein [Bdellovibrionales bacterium]|nr:patatin-like phospholipase family protein [Bdellovibrionales bacterium]
MKVSEKKHIALVLSGGGIKAAAFHIGVCLALAEKGFKFSGGPTPYDRNKDPEPYTFSTYVGSSAGSVISTFLAAGYSVESIIEAFTRGSGLEPLTRSKARGGRLRPITYRDIFALNVDAGLPSRFLPDFVRKRPVVSGGLEVLLKRGFKINGIFSTKNIEKYFRRHVYPNNDFRTLGARLYIVATQLNHSRKVVFGPYEETQKEKDIKYASYATVSQAVAASAALPPFFSPYGIKNEKGKTIHFFDGEIRDTLSTHVAAEHGADLVISSYSIQPYHFNKEMGSLHEYGIPAICNQALYQVVQQKIERHIRHQKDVRSMINAVNGYLKQAEIAEEHREKLIEILLNRTGFNPDVDYLYIHPSPQDFQFFFYDHFSLNPRVLLSIVKTGFRSAMQTLRQHNL